MPSPPGLTNFENLLFARRFLRDPRQPIEENSRRFGPIWGAMMPGKRGLVPLYFLLGPDGNERILAPKYKDDFTWYEGYQFTMEPLFGKNILLLLDDEPASASGPGEAPFRQRQRIIISAFHPRLDPEYLGQLDAIVEQHLDALPLDTELDLQWAIKRLTFHLVARLLLGAADEELDTLTHLFEELSRGLFSLVHLAIPGLPFYRARRARAALDRYLHAQLAACRAGSKSPPPLLESMLSAQQSDPTLISDEAIVGELISFLYAGYDTTASLMTSLVVALGQNPTVYARLCRGFRDRTDDERSPFGYFEGFLLEGERLFPPLPFLMRGVRRDVSFQGYDIKAGSKVAYSPHFTGRMASLYPSPEAFQPERFLDDSGSISRPSPYALVGFGGGQRMCIGKRLALLELRSFFGRLLRRFDLHFLPQKSEALYFNPAPQRKDGYRIRLTRAPDAESRAS